MGISLGVAFSDEGGGTRGYRTFAFGVLLAGVLARGASRALPGAGVGLGRWVEPVLAAADFVSQLVAVVGVALALRLLVAGLGRLPSWPHKAVLVLAQGVALLLVLLASSRALRPGGLWALLAATWASALLVAPRALWSPSTRASGLVLLLSALSSLGWASARSPLAQTLDGRLREGLGSFGFALDVAAFTICALWLWRRRPARAWLGAALGIGAVALLLMGSTGSAPGLLTAVLGALVPGPQFPLPLQAHLAFESAAFCLTVLAFSSRRQSLVSVALGLALCGRAVVDTPLGALCLSVACLLTLAAHHPSEVGAARELA